MTWYAENAVVVYSTVIMIIVVMIIVALALVFNNPTTSEEVTIERWVCEIDCGDRGFTADFSVSSDLGVEYWVGRGCVPRSCVRLE